MNIALQAFPMESTLFSNFKKIKLLLPVIPSPALLVHADNDTIIISLSVKQKALGNNISFMNLLLTDTKSISLSVR